MNGDFEILPKGAPMQFSRNSKRRFLLSATISLFCLILTLALPLILLPSPPVQALQSEINLTILHVNDTHGHIIPFLDKSVDPERPVGGAEYLAGMIERERAANPDGTILLSAGDMFQGTPVSNLFHGKPVIEIMNYLRYDAMALGNHEFDWGQDVLHSIISSASFPVISANIFERGGETHPRSKTLCNTEKERHSNRCNRHNHTRNLLHYKNWKCYRTHIHSPGKCPACHSQAGSGKGCVNSHRAHS